MALNSLFFCLCAAEAAEGPRVGRAGRLGGLDLKHFDDVT